MPSDCHRVYMCTKFDSLSRFLFYRHTQTQDTHRRYWSAYPMHTICRHVITTTYLAEARADLIVFKQAFPVTTAIGAVNGQLTEFPSTRSIRKHLQIHSSIHITHLTSPHLTSPHLIWIGLDWNGQDSLSCSVRGVFIYHSSHDISSHLVWTELNWTQSTELTSPHLISSELNCHQPKKLCCSTLCQLTASGLRLKFDIWLLSTMITTILKI